LGSTLNSDISEIRDGKQIPFFGFGKEAWEFAPEEWAKHFYGFKTLMGREKYFWALSQ